MKRLLLATLLLASLSAPAAAQEQVHLELLTGAVPARAR